MFKVHPKIAKEFAEKTKSIKSLPERVGNEKNKKVPALPIVPKIK